MIEKILESALENAGKTIVKGATAAGKAIFKHFVKNSTKYAIGGGTAAVGGVAYAIGESVGHKKRERRRDCGASCSGRKEDGRNE